MEKTMKDLMDAFAGESQANRKYTAFAKKAEAEGKMNAAKLFKAAADAETLHALREFELAGMVGSTADNLKAAAAGETYEYTEMYPEFLKDAEAEQLAEQGLAVSQAARVVGVSDNSPAARVGLREGDLLTAVDGIAISGAADLRNRIALSAPGSQVTLEYYRQGQRLTCNVRLGML